ncbi:MAG: c-type cytochrome biogenesis protein CcmI [Hyphomicrobiaceae bacterium]
MVLWLFFAAMTAALLWAVLRPYFGAKPDDDLTPGSQRLAVYKAQIAEIDADVDRGTLASDEAAGLRAEIGRRLLSQTDVEPGVSSHRSGPSFPDHRSMLTTGMLVGVPAAALAIYLSVGSPFLPAQPVASRTIQNAGNVRVAELISRVEKQLVQRPDDGEGWEVIAPVYMKMQRYADAAEAYRNAARLLGETPKRILGFAEATVFSRNGIVSEDARRAFAKILVLNPGSIPARYWLAVAKEQDGDLKAARADLASLLQGVGEDNATGRTIADHLKTLDAKIGGGETMAAAKPDVSAMIKGMVEGLAERLETEKDDFEGWMKLIRSYVVLGRNDDALKALQSARKTFAGERERLEQLRRLAQELRIET